MYSNAISILLFFIMPLSAFPQNTVYHTGPPPKMDKVYIKGLEINWKDKHDWYLQSHRGDSMQERYIFYNTQRGKNPYINGSLFIHIMVNPRGPNAIIDSRAVLERNLLNTPVGNELVVLESRQTRGTDYCLFTIRGNKATSTLGLVIQANSYLYLITFYTNITEVQKPMEDFWVAKFKAINAIRP